MKAREFWAGFRAGMPVCVGYFSVSFGFGAMAVAQGLGIWQAILISASNLTSAGQFAGLTVIAAGGLLLEMVLTQLVINSRYALMSLALSQRLGPQVGVGKRLLAAFFNTDEIFALGMSRQEPLTTAYFVGAGAIGYTEKLTRSILNKKELGMTCRAERNLARRLNDACDKLYDYCELLGGDLAKVPADTAKAAQYYGSVIVSDMAKAREQADILESLTDKKMWPYPTYFDLLFY